MTIRIAKTDDDYEVFAQWDDTAQVYEVFCDPDGIGYIGCADTLREASAVAFNWICEKRAEG